MKEPRGRIISLRLTEEEFGQLTEEADQQGVTVSRLLRSLAFNHQAPPMAEVLEQLARLHMADSLLNHGGGTEAPGECSLCDGIRQVQLALVNDVTTPATSVTLAQ